MMKKINISAILFWCMWLFFACEAKEHKVILVNVRGTSYINLKNYLRLTVKESYLKELLNRGSILPLKPIENAVTVTNLASFETGTFPNKHGIIGHTFGSDENSYSEPISGFAKLFEEETIWETAGKSGLQVLRIGSLIVHGNKAQEQQQNVDCVAQGEVFGSCEKIFTNT